MPHQIVQDTRQNGLRVLKVVVPKGNLTAAKVKKLAQYLKDDNGSRSLGIDFFDDREAAKNPVAFGKENTVPLKNERFWLHYLAQYEYTDKTKRERYVPLAPLDNP